MKALVKSFPRPGIWVEDVPMPQIGPHDVLVKIIQTAICGTDIHLYNWDDWAKQHVQVPLIIGHEFVGEIIEVGDGAAGHFKIGDRVSGEGHIACGHCRNCRSGKSHLCRKNTSVGISRNGCFAEYLCLPASNAYRLPASLPHHIGAVLDPLGNAAHTALSFDLVGEDVLITGAGPVGLMAAAIARHVGARYIVITDINPYRLKMAESMGVTLAIAPSEAYLQKAMGELGMLEGFDVGLEMSGNAHAFNDMITFMNHAGKVALLGFLPHGAAVNWSQVIMKGLTLKGIYGREMFDTWYKMTTMLQSGLDISHIVTHKFLVDDYQQAFEAMRSGLSGKVILNWQAST